MRLILLRLIPCLTVFLGGLGCLVYGTRYHTLSVTEEQEIRLRVPEDWAGEVPEHCGQHVIAATTASKDESPNPP